MPLIDAYRLRKKVQVMRDTWGHLDPAPGTYPGWILFAHTSYGELVLLDEAFEGRLTGPGFFEQLHAYVADTAEGQQGLYEFQGEYQRCKNGRGRFLGTVTVRPLETLRGYYTARVHGHTLEATRGTLQKGT